MPSHAIQSESSGRVTDPPGITTACEPSAEAPLGLLRYLPPRRPPRPENIEESYTGTAAFGFDALLGVLSARRQTSARACAFLRQRESRAFADASRTAGDYDGLSFRRLPCWRVHRSSCQSLPSEAGVEEANVIRSPCRCETPRRKNLARARKHAQEAALSSMCWMKQCAVSPGGPALAAFALRTRAGASSFRSSRPTR